MDANITAMAETLTPTLMEIKQNPVNGTHSLWGVTDSEPHYIKQYSSKFVVSLKKKIIQRQHHKICNNFQSPQIGSESHRKEHRLRSLQSLQQRLCPVNHGRGEQYLVHGAQYPYQLLHIHDVPKIIQAPYFQLGLPP